MMTHIRYCVVLSVVALAGCQTMKGVPGEVFPSGTAERERPVLDAVVFDTRLSEDAIKTALATPTKQSRNGVVFARIAEIDALYGAYENAILAESRKTGFVLSFSGLAAGLLGGYTTGVTSRVYSLIGGGISAAQTSYDKEVLAESTIQAFMSKMRAGRAAVRAEIFNNLRADAGAYPIEAALGDLRRYQQAGTLAAAIAGITELASRDERQQDRVAKTNSENLFNHRLPDDQFSQKSLYEYVAIEGNAMNYLDLAQEKGAKIIAVPDDLYATAVNTISYKNNQSINKIIAKQLNLK